jgi:hypothetical protein
VGRLGGPSGPSWRGPCPFVLKRGAFGLFAGFKWGFPSLFKGTPRAVPDTFNRHFIWVINVEIYNFYVKVFSI